MTDQLTADAEVENQRKWRPLTSRQRRVLGVLVEKAKTTPDAYPMTLNALTNGCNQKSNRSPLMNLKPDDVEEPLEELREMAAVTEIQGSGRVAKFRHYAYDWLGVDKTESAVITELLLRGEQTIGELRGRAARMEPIADLGALRPIVRSLMEKGLVVSLTPEGRGQIVTHGLYTEREMNEIKAEPRSAPSPSQPTASSAPSRQPAPDITTQLRSEIEGLRAEIEQLGERVRSIELRID